jgi:hypothetical protein
MLQMARQFWRRLVSRQEDGPAVEDRRARPRHYSDVATAIRLGEGQVRLPARVLNVSPGGAGVLVGAALEPGAVIAVEVPGGTAESSSVALACVVYVRPLGEGEWVAGCSFCKELSDEDFAAFAARPAPLETDLRSSERFSGNAEAAFELVGEESGRYTARVLNISLGGIALVADQPIEAGALLNLELHRTDGQAPRTLLACVVHVTTRPGNEWVLGCNFLNDLPEAELETLL